jgi:hypothetical protein
VQTFCAFLRSRLTYDNVEDCIGVAPAVSLLLARIGKNIRAGAAPIESG